MRIWDVPPERLCRQHLLGEHRELHGLWNILTQGKSGYSRHPETVRWRGKLAALYIRHETLVIEMTRRGYRHGTPLDPTLAIGEAVQIVFVDTIERQYELLREKGCDCDTSRRLTDWAIEGDDSADRPESHERTFPADVD